MTINKCPFCNSANTALMWKTSRGEDRKIKAKAYVRCADCQARGPAFTTDDISYEHGIRSRAAECWNGIPPKLIITTLPKRGVSNV
jgi:hypothetical protein